MTFPTDNETNKVEHESATWNLVSYSWFIAIVVSVLTLSALLKALDFGGDTGSQNQLFWSPVLFWILVAAEFSFGAWLALTNFSRFQCLCLVIFFGGLLAVSATRMDLATKSAGVLGVRAYRTGAQPRSAEPSCWWE